MNARFRVGWSVLLVLCVAALALNAAASASSWAPMTSGVQIGNRITDVRILNVEEPPSFSAFLEECRSGQPVMFLAKDGSRSIGWIACQLTSDQRGR